MTASTISATTVTLTDQATGGAVAGAVTYNATTRVVTFNPTADLGAGKVYLMRIGAVPPGSRTPTASPSRPTARGRFTVAGGGGGTTCFLSDLPYTVTANGWGPVEKDKSNGENAAGDGGAAHPRRGRLTPRASARMPRPMSATR